MKIAVPVAGLLALSITGCSVDIRTEERPADSCYAHPLRGVLVADEEHGVALLIEGKVWGVIWPHGYVARQELGGLVLVGPDMVAHQGDEIASSGMGLATGDGLAHPCGKVFVSRKAGSEPSAE